MRNFRYTVRTFKEQKGKVKKRKGHQTNNQVGKGYERDMKGPAKEPSVKKH